MTDPLLAIVSPVFTINGELVGNLARDCVRLEVTEGSEGLRTLQAHFLGVGPGTTGPPSAMLYLDGATVDFGKSIQVSLGPPAAQRIVFEGTISGIEAIFGDSEPPRVVVYAEDALMRLRMTRRMRSYKNVTDAEVAAQIAGEHGLQTEVAADGPRYKVLQQVNQSDLAFLRERARLLQAEVWCTGRKLHFTSRSRRQGTALTLVQGNELLSVRLRADLAHQRSSVVVTGFDAATRAVINERAGAEVMEAEAARGRTGPRVVEKALGASVSFRVREAALNAAEAKAWADAEMLRRGRSFVTAVGTTRGSPDMVVGSNLSLQSVGAPFDGPGYYVTWVRHVFEHVHGLRTGFEAERATVNEAGR